MRKIIFLLLSGIVTIIILFIFIYVSLPRKQQSKPNNNLPTPTPVKIVPQKSPPPKNNIPLFDQNNLINQLPIETQAYNIEYLVMSNTFVITIKESPYETNRRAAEDFFYKNGVTDLSKIRVTYNSYRWVK